MAKWPTTPMACRNPERKKIGNKNELLLLYLPVGYLAAAAAAAVVKVITSTSFFFQL